MSERSATRNPLRLLAVLMGIALLAWLIVRTGAGAVLEHARAVGWGMLLILALGGISHLLRTSAWRLTFRSDIRSISLARTFALRLISEAIGNFGLAGQVVGDTLRVSLLGRSVPMADRISSVALDRGMYMMAAAVVSVTGVVASVLLLPLPGAWRIYALIFAASLSVLLVFTVVSFRKGWRFLSRATGGIQRLPWARKWLSGKVSVIESAEENLLTFHTQAPKAFWGATTLYFVSQLLAVAEVYLLLRFMGVRITSVGALVIEALTKLISVVGALNPGNVGTYEGGNLVLAHLLGFSAAAGLTLALCRRARTLFWAGIGALCFIAFSRSKEDREKSMDGVGSQHVIEPSAGANKGNEAAPLDGPALIIVVDQLSQSGSFVPPLARVGSLPVLLRVVLSARLLRPSRLIVSVPSSIFRVVADALRRTHRLPNSVEWHERDANASLGSFLAHVAAESDRVVLLSGTHTYKPSLLHAAVGRAGATDAEMFKSGIQGAGIVCLSRAAALRVATESNGKTLEEIQQWIAVNCNTDAAQVPREEWQAVATPEDCPVAELKLDSWLMKPTDGRFARFNRRISIPISRQIIKTPVTPNVVTFLILAVSIGAGLFYSYGGYWNMLAGALLSVWASILDGCDGEVARLKLQSSELGCWLDTICDYIYYVVLFAGMMWGLNRTSATHLYLKWGSVLAFGTLLSFFVVGWLRRRVAGDHPDKFLARWQNRTEKQSSNPLLFFARNTEFIIRRCFFPYALLVAAVLNLTKEVFVITAISANIAWTVALYSSLAFPRKNISPGRLQPHMQPDASLNVPF